MKPVGDHKRLSNDTDPRIIDGLRMGDHACYKTVFYNYHNSINNFLRALTKSEEVANDITQEVFLTLWEKRETLESDKGIVRFLFRLAKQALIHHYRHSEVRNSYAKVTMASGGDTGGARGDELLEAEETQLLIQIAISKMPEMRRKVFEFNRYEDLSIEEIALLLNISKDSVSSHLYNALRDIKNVLPLFLLFLSLCK